MRILKRVMFVQLMLLWMLLFPPILIISIISNPFVWILTGETSMMDRTLEVCLDIRNFLFEMVES
jgi:hypothetical protein